MIALAATSGNVSSLGMAYSILTLGAGTPGLDHKAVLCRLLACSQRQKSALVGQCVSFLQAKLTLFSAQAEGELYAGVCPLDGADGKNQEEPS